MAKLNIDFILIDDSVVMNGFRALMSGAQLSSFVANPVMLLMHNRATPGLLNAPDNDAMLPIGKWYDIRVEGNKLLAKPDFDDADPFALKVQSKVEGGYLKGASIWIDPLKVSNDAALKLQGQNGPTITGWGVLEASIVDIPNCKNALAIKNSAGDKLALYGNAGPYKEVNDYLLSLIDKKNTMDKNLLCATLGLDVNATDTQITEALLAFKNSAAASLQLAGENKTLGDEIIRLKKEATDKKITDLVDGGIDSKKLMAGDRDRFVKLATADFDTVKELIDGMKPYESIAGKLAAGGASTAEKAELADLLKLSGEQLYKQDGKLARLKQLDMETFKVKYKEALGVEYTEA